MEKTASRVAALGFLVGIFPYTYQLSGAWIPFWVLSPPAGLQNSGPGLRHWLLPKFAACTLVLQILDLPAPYFYIHTYFYNICIHAYIKHTHTHTHLGGEREREINWSLCLGLQCYRQMNKRPTTVHRGWHWAEWCVNLLAKITSLKQMICFMGDVFPLFLACWRFIFMLKLYILDLTLFTLVAEIKVSGNILTDDVT